MLASLIAAFASGETIIALRRARNALFAYGLAAISGLFGLIFLLIAGYVAAAQRYGPVQAALIAGCIFIFIAVLIILIHKLAAIARERRTARRRKGEMTRIGIAASVAVLPTLLAGRAGKAMLLAPVVAAVAYAIYRRSRRGDVDEDD